MDVARRAGSWCERASVSPWVGRTQRSALSHMHSCCLVLELPRLQTLPRKQHRGALACDTRGSLLKLHWLCVWSSMRGHTHPVHTSGFLTEAQRQKRLLPARSATPAGHGGRAGASARWTARPGGGGGVWEITHPLASSASSGCCSARNIPAAISGAGFIRAAAAMEAVLGPFEAFTCQALWFWFGFFFFSRMRTSWLCACSPGSPLSTACAASPLAWWCSWPAWSWPPFMCIATTSSLT